MKRVGELAERVVTDRVLQSVPAARRDTLIAQPVEGKAGALTWDVRLQGDGETAFFEY